MDVRLIPLGIFVSLLMTGCAGDDPIEVFRTVQPTQTTHLMIVPSSVRSAGDERVIQSQLLFTELQPESFAAINKIRAYQLVNAYDCDARTYRELMMVVFFNDGRESKEPLKTTRTDVLPGSPQEAAMSFACSSTLTRAWKRVRNKPVIFHGR